MYVNAEHDGNVGVITISRETYNSDVDAELNRAIDWLKAEGIANVIVTGDFHLATQMVGADTSEFFPALDDVEDGRRVAATWSATARRLHDEFKVSVGFVGGKRCLGGFLELLMHCHYLVAVEDAVLGMPEVTLPVVPGMEGCHWPFRKADPSQWPKLVRMLLTGAPVKAKDAVDWLIDYSGPMQDSLEMAWSLASGGDGRRADEETGRGRAGRYTRGCRRVGFRQPGHGSGQEEPSWKRSGTPAASRCLKRSMSRPGTPPTSPSPLSAGKEASEPSTEGR